MSVSVTLQGAYASDVDVVNAAMVSGGKSIEVLDRKGVALINKLMSARPVHGSPFAHNYFKFHVVVPIFVQRDWFRHTVFHAYNEVSTRWQSMDELGVYEPELLREQVGKSWEYRYEDFDPDSAGALARTKHAWRKRYLVRSQQKAMRRYKRMLKRGYAREQAMATLPMGTYTEFIWSCNARSLMNFLSLRAQPNARKEIQEAAHQVEQAFALQMPVTYEAWVTNDRVAP